MTEILPISKNINRSIFWKQFNRQTCDKCQDPPPPFCVDVINVCSLKGKQQIDCQGHTLCAFRQHLEITKILPDLKTYLSKGKKYPTEQRSQSHMELGPTTLGFKFQCSPNRTGKLDTRMI